MKTRKILALVLALVMIVSMLSACGGKKAGGSPEDFDVASFEWETEPGTDKYAGRTLRVLQTIGGGGNYYEPVVERMKEFYPGLEIEYVYTQGAADMLRTQILDGNAPDIFNVNTGDLPIYDAIDQGICAPVDAIFDVPTLDGTQKLGDLLDMSIFANGEKDGVHYSMKDMMYIMGLWYDANYFEANGLTVPTDWASMQQFAADCDALGIDALGACGLMSHEYPTNYWWWPMVASTDYDLYVKLLNEAVLEERGEKGIERFESQIVIGISAHIPEYYIKSSAARMEMYKKISFIESQEERDDLYDEFADRFGDVPRTVERLMDVALAKALAERARVKKIEHSGLRLTFVTERPDLAVWSELFAMERSLSFLGLGSPLIVYRLRKDEDPTAVAARIMSEYVEIMDSDDKEKA